MRLAPLLLTLTAAINGGGSMGASGGVTRPAEVAVPAPWMTACVGDSITLGNVVATPYPTTLRTVTGNPLVANLGVVSDRAEFLLARWSPLAASYDHAAYLIGANDLRVGRTAAAIYADLQAVYAVPLKNSSTDRYVVTVMPFRGDGSWSAAKQLELLALNDLIRATPGVTVIDLYPVFNDPANDGAMLQAYDSGDDLHPNQAGATAMATIIGAAMNANP